LSIGANRIDFDYCEAFDQKNMHIVGAPVACVVSLSTRAWSRLSRTWLNWDCARYLLELVYGRKDGADSEVKGICKHSRSSFQRIPISWNTIHFARFCETV
jgi:hypothetical protein